MELHKHRCCDMQRVYKGAWTAEEDAILTAYMEAHGNESRSWKRIASYAGLKRCGKSCRFRWIHYLSPTIDRRSFSVQEVELICNLHGIIGNKWTEIAKFLPGRSDNFIKNFWNAYCKQLPELTTTLTNNHPILQQDRNPSTNYDFTHSPTDQFFTSPVVNTSSINHLFNLQDFDPPSMKYDLLPLPQSLPSPIIRNPTYDYSLFDYDSSFSSGWMDPSYSHNQVIDQQPRYLESSNVYHLLGTQDHNHLMGNSVYDHPSSDLNNHDLMESEANNVHTSNNPSMGYSGTDMVIQATNCGLHNF